jgi:hypothetical protein
VCHTAVLKEISHTLVHVFLSNKDPEIRNRVLSVCVLCVGKEKSLREADHSSRVGLPNVVCLSAIVKLRY